MTQHCMRSYTQLLIQTCHRRGVHAMGGMAAQIPIKDDPKANKVRRSMTTTPPVCDPDDTSCQRSSCTAQRSNRSPDRCLSTLIGGALQEGGHRQVVCTGLLPQPW